MLMYAAWTWSRSLIQGFAISFKCLDTVALPCIANSIKLIGFSFSLHSSDVFGVPQVNYCS